MLDKSILQTTKKLVNLPEGYTDFDMDIVIHINATFAKLRQLGVGPALGFSIMDDQPKWSDFIGDQLFINDVVSYMGLCVRLLFDPPANSFTIAAMEKIKAETEWRMTVAVDEQRALTPVVVVAVVPPVI